METPKNFFTPHVAKYIINNATLFLALLSGYMYVCAYTYEQAYLKEFGISSTHLILDINTILRDSTRIISIIVLLTGIYQILSRLLQQFLTKSKLYREVAQTIITLFVVLLLTWLYFPVNKHLFVYIFSIIGIIYFFVLLSAFLKTIQKANRKTPNSAFSDAKQYDYGFNKYYIYIFLFIINPIFICQLLGQGEAFRQHSFEVIHDSTNRAIIRQYGDKIICKSLTKTNQIENNIVVVISNNIKSINLSNMELGYISTSHVSESNLVAYLKQYWF